MINESFKSLQLIRFGLQKKTKFVENRGSVKNYLPSAPTTSNLYRKPSLMLKIPAFLPVDIVYTDTKKHYI